MPSLACINGADPAALLCASPGGCLRPDPTHHNDPEIREDHQEPSLPGSQCSAHRGDSASGQGFLYSQLQRPLAELDLRSSITCPHFLKQLYGIPSPLGPNI